MDTNGSATLTEQIALLKADNESLANERVRLQHLIACAPAVTYSFVAYGEFRPTFISDNFKELFGYESHDYLHNAQFIQSRVHPEGQ